MPPPLLTFQESALFFTLATLRSRAYKWDLDEETVAPKVAALLSETTGHYPEKVSPTEFGKLFDPWLDEHLPALVEMVEVSEDPVTVYPV